MKSWQTLAWRRKQPSVRNYWGQTHTGLNPTTLKATCLVYFKLVLEHGMMESHLYSRCGCVKKRNCLGNISNSFFNMIIIHSVNRLKFEILLVTSYCLLSFIITSKLIGSGTPSIPGPFKVREVAESLAKQCNFLPFHVEVRNVEKVLSHKINHIRAVGSLK